MLYPMSSREYYKNRQKEIKYVLSMLGEKQFKIKPSAYPFGQLYRVLGAAYVQQWTDE